MKITKEKIKHIIKNPFRIFIWLITRLPYFHFLKGTEYAMNKITFKMWYKQRVIGYNREAYWPVHFTSKVVGTHNILVGVGSNPGFNPGVYVQGSGKLYIGDYTTVGQNSGILSGGHDFYDHRILTSDETRIGSYCWIGMNATILPGVVLGDFTVVASGAVVSKSFPEGNCIIGGVPAKKIKDLDPNKQVCFEYRTKYHGYIKQSEFEKFRKKNLNI
ncbi:acyltransferase [Winogradskyella wichelsiae]|uniref:acyltransferase n=1 Tax=Winogradskyella wichelsiae TaxID=2697007 RepID=UPI003EF502EC